MSYIRLNTASASLLHTIHKVFCYNHRNKNTMYTKLIRLDIYLKRTCEVLVIVRSFILPKGSPDSLSHFISHEAKIMVAVSIKNKQVLGLQCTTIEGDDSVEARRSSLGASRHLKSRSLGTSWNDV